MKETRREIYAWGGPTPDVKMQPKTEQELYDISIIIQDFITNLVDSFGIHVVLGFRAIKAQPDDKPETIEGWDSVIFLGSRDSVQGIVLSIAHKLALSQGLEMPEDFFKNHH